MTRFQVEDWRHRVPLRGLRTGSWKVTLGLEKGVAAPLDVTATP